MAAWRVTGRSPSSDPPAPTDPPTFTPAPRGIAERSRTALRNVLADDFSSEHDYAAKNSARYLHTLNGLQLRARPAPTRIVDIGFYPGHLARAVHAIVGGELHGLGPRFPPAFHTGARSRGIALHECDVERRLLPFPSGSVDLILATEVLEHLAAPALMLTECRRVLAPAGLLLLSTPNLLSLRGRLRAILGRSPQSHLFGIREIFCHNEWVHRREFVAHEVAALLRGSGFALLDLHTWTPTRLDRWKPLGVHARGAPLLQLGGSIHVAAVPDPAGHAAGRAGDRARLRTVPSALDLRCGENASLEVSIENLGTEIWDSQAARPVNAGLHLLDVDGQVLDLDLARAPLPGTVQPGQTVPVTIPFRGPLAPGAYVLEADLVREHVHWFADDGSPTARALLRIS